MAFRAWSAAKMLLSELFSLYRSTNLNLGQRAAENYEVAVRAYAQFLKRHPTIDDLAELSIRLFLSDLRDRGRAARTVNGKRQVLLTLWRFAVKERLVSRALGEVPRMRVPRSVPTAWTIQEVGRILSACRVARRLRRGWGPEHWEAMVLAAYDTSHRLDTLLKVERSQLDDQGFLLAFAQQIKYANKDQIHRLHPDTLAAIAKLPPHRLLFPWPYHRRAIWLEYGTILRAAGLPDGERDKFHRLRRTSYSYCAKELGLSAATQHAGHNADLSRFYLDPRIVGGAQVTDFLPRPKLS